MSEFGEPFAAIFAKAFAAYEIRNLDQCELLIGQGLALQPENMALLSLGGQVMLLRSRYGLARSGAQRMIELDPEDDRGFSLLAWATIQDDNYCPDDADFDPELDNGNAAWRLRLKTAETLNSRCLEIDPVDAQHWLLKSKLHLFRDQFNESLQAAETGLKFSPENYGLHHYRILAFEKKGDTESAYSALLEQLQRMPEDDTAHNKLAQIYLSKKQVSQAISHARNALRIAPDSEENRETFWDAMMASNSFIGKFVYLRFVVRRLRDTPKWVHYVAMAAASISLLLVFIVSEQLREPWGGILICSSIFVVISGSIFVASDRPFMPWFDLYLYFGNPEYRATINKDKHNENLTIVIGVLASIVFLASLALQVFMPVALMLLAVPVTSIYFSKSWKSRSCAIVMSIVSVILLWFGLNLFVNSAVKTTSRVYAVQMLVAYCVSCIATGFWVHGINEKTS